MVYCFKFQVSEPLRGGFQDSRFMVNGPFMVNGSRLKVRFNHNDNVNLNFFLNDNEDFSTITIARLCRLASPRTLTKTIKNERIGEFNSWCLHSNLQSLLARDVL